MFPVCNTTLRKAGRKSSEGEGKSYMYKTLGKVSEQNSQGDIITDLDLNATNHILQRKDYQACSILSVSHRSWRISVGRYFEDFVLVRLEKFLGFFTYFKEI